MQVIHRLRAARYYFDVKNGRLGGEKNLLGIRWSRSGRGGLGWLRNLRSQTQGDAKHN
jgi:hypothetical protein